MNLQWSLKLSFLLGSLMLLMLLMTANICWSLQWWSERPPLATAIISTPVQPQGHANARGPAIGGHIPPFEDVEFTNNIDSHDISINTDEAITTVDERFLSVVLDPHLIRVHWRNFNLSSSRLFTLARGLHPAYLRVGGTDEDFLLYKEAPDNSISDSIGRSKSRMLLHADSDRDEFPKQNEEENFSDPVSGYLDSFDAKKDLDNFTITSADLDKIHEIAVGSGWDVFFGLNVLLRNSDDNTWNYSNPLEIMQYAARKRYNFTWQLGNEPNHLNKFGPPVTATQLGHDFITLKKILESSPELGTVVVGPDVDRLGSEKAQDYLTKFLIVAQDTVHAVTWHQYYVNGRTSALKDFYDPYILDTMIDQLNDVNDILSKRAPDKRGWLGETGSAWGGGAPGISDRYAAGFMWLDKLGLAARLKHDVVMRESFFGGNYALINDDLEPNPDYWLSLLYKRLVGQKVLQVDGSLTRGRKVRVYAHCTNTRLGIYQAGAVTIIALNLNSDNPAVLRLTGDLQGLQVDQYQLIPDGDDLRARKVKLNGNVISLIDDTTLPSLRPLRVSPDKISLPPLSFAFFVVPMATAQACKQ